MVALPERGGIAIQGGMVAAQELLFERRGTAHAYRFGVMLWHGMAAIALVDEARMRGDRDAAMEDLNLGGIFVDAQRVAHEALRHRIPIRVDGNVAVQIDHAL